MRRVFVVCFVLRGLKPVLFLSAPSRMAEAKLWSVFGRSEKERGLIAVLNREKYVDEGISIVNKSVRVP